MKLYNLRFFLKVILIVLGAIYPFVVYFGLTRYGFVLAAVFLLIFIVIKWYLDSGDSPLKWVYVIAITMCLLSIVKKNEIWIQFYPVLMSFGFFIIFVNSLCYPPTVVERLARLKYPQLDIEGVRCWTYKVTLAWAIFFLLNGLIATITVLYGSLAFWTLYNGLISYLLMGLLFAIEWLWRCIRVRRVK